MHNIIFCIYVFYREYSVIYYINIESYPSYVNIVDEISKLLHHMFIIIAKKITLFWELLTLK